MSVGRIDNEPFRVNAGDIRLDRDTPFANYFAVVGKFQYSLETIVLANRQFAEISHFQEAHRPARTIKHVAVREEVLLGKWLIDPHQNFENFSRIRTTCLYCKSNQQGYDDKMPTTVSANTHILGGLCRVTAIGHKPAFYLRLFERRLCGAWQSFASDRFLHP